MGMLASSNAPPLNADQYTRSPTHFQGVSLALPDHCNVNADSSTIVEIPTVLYGKVPYLLYSGSKAVRFQFMLPRLWWNRSISRRDDHLLDALIS
jgi:hypothetical protein